MIQNDHTKDVMKKIISLILATMLILGSLTGCGSSSESKETSDLENASVVDQQEDNADAANGPLKVISLAPNITEILFSIGADDMIVGRTDYCDYPAEAANIDSIGTYSAPNMELIISKSPDLVIASDFIDENIQKQLEELGAEVYVFEESGIDKIEEQILTIGDKLGLSANAEKVVEDMKATSKLIEEKGNSVSEKKSVFFDLGSYYTAGPGSFLDSVLKDISTENIAESTGEMWPQMSVETIVAANPDVYISSFTTEDELKGVSGLSGLECMKEGNLLILDQDLANRIQRAGPRLAEAELELMELIYE